MRVEPSPDVTKELQERTLAGQCLCCDRPQLKRGLCHRCYYRWRRQRAQLPTNAKRVEFDARLIRLGKLLAAQAIRGYKRSDMFDQVAKQVS